MASTAIDSLRYAFSRDLLGLYAVVVLGTVLSNSPTLVPGFYRPVTQALEFVVGLLGVAIVLGSLVAILHRVLTDVGR